MKQTTLAPPPQNVKPLWPMLAALTLMLAAAAAGFLGGAQQTGPRHAEGPGEHTIAFGGIRVDRSHGPENYAIRPSRLFCRDGFYFHQLLLALPGGE